MKKFKNLKEAINWLEIQKRFRDKTNLDIMNLAYQKLNLDFSKTIKYHILGTNGKGSTSAFITNVLTNNQISVGTFTSPYLIDFNERIKVNNKNISNDELLTLINEIYDFNELLKKENEVSLSFFELLTLMAFIHFNRLGLDVIIMEAGIGGRLDATNVLTYDATIITSIGFDHQNVLGNNLKDIALEKIGALKDHGLLIANPTKKIKKIYLKDISTKRANYEFVDKHAFKKLKDGFVYRDNFYNLKLLGDYQMSNALLSFIAIKKFFNINDNLIVESLNETKWAGRLEKIDNNVYIDGAHNVSAISALAKSINSIFKKQKINILFSALKDKEIAAMIKILKKHRFKITLTKFDDPRFESLNKYRSRKIKYEEAPFKALKKLKEENGIVIVTGSLHFIGYIKKYYQK